MSSHMATWFSSVGTEMWMLAGRSLCPRLFTCTEDSEGQGHAEPPALPDRWLLGPPPWAMFPSHHTCLVSVLGRPAALLL